MTSQKLEFETTLGLDELSLGQDGETLRFIVGAKHELHLIDINELADGAISSDVKIYELEDDLEKLRKEHATDENLKKKISKTESLNSKIHDLENDISVYRPDLKTTKIVKDKIKKISEIIKELKGFK